MIAEAISNTQIQLHWEDRSDNEQFFVLETLKNGVFVVLDTLGANETTFRHENLKDATTYHYQVKAVNEYGNFGYNNLGYSNQASATTWMLDQGLQVPGNLAIEPLEEVGLYLSWTSDITEGYVFEIFRLNDAKTTYHKIAESIATNWLDDQLQSNARYTYRIRIKQGQRVSAFSEPIDGLTFPSTPQNFQAILQKSSQALLSWESDNHSSMPLYYILEKSSDSADFEAWVELVQDQLTYLDTAVHQGKFYYKIRAKNASGYSAYSRIVVLEFSDEPGNNISENVQIKPNPVLEELIVNFRHLGEGKVQIRLFNSQGKLLANKELDKEETTLNFTLPVQEFPKGSYVMHIKFGDQSWIKRFIKH